MSVAPAPKPISCGIWPGTDEYRWFLKHPGGETGEWLPHDQFIARYEQVHHLATLPRCADPRCNEPFESNRADQRYCQASCNTRHRNRMAYRAENGLPLDEPPVIKPDAQSKRHAQLVRLMAEAKARYDANPPPRIPKPMVIGRAKDGAELLRLPSAVRRDEELARTDRARLTEHSRAMFYFDLRHAGVVIRDLGRTTDPMLSTSHPWSDLKEEGADAGAHPHNEHHLYMLWQERGDKLPDDLQDWIDPVAVRERALNEEWDEKYFARKAAQTLAEAAERAKKLSPVTMDDAAGGDGA